MSSESRKPGVARKVVAFAAGAALLALGLSSLETVEKSRKERQEKGEQEEEGEQDDRLNEDPKELKCSVCGGIDEMYALDCGHLACSTCAFQMDDCKVCGKRVFQRLRLRAPSASSS